VSDFFYGASLVLGLWLMSTASATTTTGFLKREVKTGQTKQCVYVALGATHIVTVQSFELCPLTIEVKS
jgi:hypothetical protein